MEVVSRSPKRAWCRRRCGGERRVVPGGRPWAGTPLAGVPQHPRWQQHASPASTAHNNPPSSNPLAPCHSQESVAILGLDGTIVTLPPRLPLAAAWRGGNPTRDAAAPLPAPADQGLSIGSVFSIQASNGRDATRRVRLLGFCQGVDRLHGAVEAAVLRRGGAVVHVERHVNRQGLWGKGRWGGCGPTATGARSWNGPARTGRVPAGLVPSSKRLQSTTVPKGNRPPSRRLFNPQRLGGAAGHVRRAAVPVWRPARVRSPASLRAGRRRHHPSQRAAVAAGLRAVSAAGRCGFPPASLHEHVTTTATRHAACTPTHTVSAPAGAGQPPCIGQAQEFQRCTHAQKTFSDVADPDQFPAHRVPAPPWARAILQIPVEQQEREPPVPVHGMMWGPAHHPKQARAGFSSCRLRM